MNHSYENPTYGASRPWDHDQDFSEVLGEQLQRAPYLVASVVLHFLLALIVAGIMVLNTDAATEPPQLVAAPPMPPPDIEDVEPPEPLIVPDPIPEPVVQEADLEPTEQPESLEALGDPNMNSDKMFDSLGDNGDLGLGGGAGGSLGGPGGRGGGGGGTPSEAAVVAGLQWLRDHQNQEGFWDADEFMLEDRYPEQPASTGEGNSVNDVGLSGLALLAFLGNNHTLNHGPHRQVVARGINWLLEVQDQDSGLFGEEVGNSTLYNHAIATMAMGEAYYFSAQSPLLKRPMSQAVKVIVKAQNPYGAWRYSLEPNGDNDSSITGWMVFALKTAKENHLAVNQQAFDGAQEWFHTMQDKNTGRVGYAWGEGGGGPGSAPSRPAIYLDEFPAAKSESLTAVALLSQVFMTDTDEVRRWSDHPDYSMMKKAADLIASKPPVWNEKDGSIDMYYWYYGTYAMNQWGGKHWKTWKKGLEQALLPHQRHDSPNGQDNFTGSWDSVGPWGDEGGRVYATAICTLMLEVYYRYAQVLGAR